MRRTFLDGAVDDEFRSSGYTILDLLDPGRLGALRAIVDEIYVGPRSGMHTTIQSDDFEYRRKVLSTVPRAFDGLLDDVLDDHDVLTAALLIKWPGEDTGFCTHQDWSMVDERRFRSVNIWCPLVDVEAENGALVVLPGSHRHLDHLRCSPMNPRDFVSEGTEVSYREMDPLPMSAGQALFFDNGLLHGSGPNLTDSPRIVALLSMKPREAAIQHYFLPDGDSWVAERYEVDPDFFADFRIGERPKYELTELVPFYGTPRPKQDLLALCGREPLSSEDAPLIAPPPLPELSAGTTGTRVGATSNAQPDASLSKDGRFRTLRDRALDDALADDGFVVVDLMDLTEVRELDAVANRLYVDDRSGFHASNLSASIEYRRAVVAEVTPLIARLAGDLFVDHEAYTASLLMKWPDQDSAFHTHQDWNMVDERVYRTVNVWCPLVDSTETNGALRVLPGSHRVLKSIRCSPMPPDGCNSVGWQVGWDEMDVIEVAAGQALIFDHGLLHSSGPNSSDLPRGAVAAAFRPRSAELFHWYLPDPSKPRLEVFSIDASFFSDINIGERPDAEVVGDQEFEWEPMTKEELLWSCGRDLPASTEPHLRPVLRDPVLQARLDRDGWVTVPLFGAAQVDELVARHGGMDHEIVLDRSFASGFHATIMDGRREYRREAHDTIASVVAEPFARLFDRMTLTLTNWLYKAPDSDAVPKHVDWTFVDEEQHRSVSVWVPLVDTDEEHGCIGVVTGSHREVGFVRAAAHPSYQDIDAFGGQLDGHLELPLKAGEAVVFDHRLVHFSNPHRGESARLAVTCELVPNEAEVVHYEWLGPGRFRRHHVTPEFFVTYAAGTDPATVPGHLGSVEVEAPSFDQLVGLHSEQAGDEVDLGPSTGQISAEGTPPFRRSFIAKIGHRLRGLSRIG